jgi:hypothetical protein
VDIIEMFSAQMPEVPFSETLVRTLMFNNAQVGTVLRFFMACSSKYLKIWQRLVENTSCATMAIQR